MTELETLKRAKLYIDKLSNGIDPLTDSEIKNDSVLNNVRISRCLFYVSGVLGKVIENGGEVKKTAGGKSSFTLTKEQLENAEISDTPVGVSIIAKRINALLDENVKGISAVKIANWLVEEGYLAENIRSGKREKVTSEKGRALGIETVEAFSPDGVPYRKNIYNLNAQRFVIDNVMNIAEDVHGG